MTFKIDKQADKSGLPESMLVPIAARSVEDAALYVGTIEQQIVGRSGRVNAMAIRPHNWPVKKESNTPLWTHENASEYEQCLHPGQQIWVHVDYRNYRKAYLELSETPIPDGFFLDHIQNREAIRLREYSHPYLRLCPVSRQVNTSGGTNTGGEGMEKEFLRSLKDKPKAERDAFLKKLDHGVVYADPMDLTKMVGVLPGTQVLDGVRVMLKLFYAKQTPAKEDNGE